MIYHHLKFVKKTFLGFLITTLINIGLCFEAKFEINKEEPSGFIVWNPKELEKPIKINYMEYKKKIIPYINITGKVTQPIELFMIGSTKVPVSKNGYFAMRIPLVTEVQALELKLITNEKNTVLIQCTTKTSQWNKIKKETQKLTKALDKSYDIILSSFYSIVHTEQLNSIDASTDQTNTSQLDQALISFKVLARKRFKSIFELSGKIFGTAIPLKTSQPNTVLRLVSGQLNIGLFHTFSPRFSGRLSIGYEYFTSFTQSTNIGLQNLGSLPLHVGSTLLIGSALRFEIYGGFGVLLDGIKVLNISQSRQFFVGTSFGLSKFAITAEYTALQVFYVSSNIGTNDFQSRLLSAGIQYKF